jgi:hypothetical protein
MNRGVICAAIAIPLWVCLPLRAADPAVADVVVIVDTSTSMSSPGMDPQRTSLLVAKLFADIVPGDLAVIRLLDLSKDIRWLPSKNTGKKVPCSEDPSRTCEHIEPIGDWYADVHAHRYGALIRPARGDSGFKQQLDSHLAQVINNSVFGLAFRAAQGVFDTHPSSAAARTVIWLSDGNSDDAGPLQTVLGELQGAGVTIEPVVFGKGTTELQKKLGLVSIPVRSAGELMKAFAGVFRHLVQAPYELDSLLSSNPTFDMKLRVDEAWVVVYGDDTLGDVTIDSPRGPLHADYAQDRRQNSGAYRVLYVQNPPAGKWTIHATGGGSGAAYAVVQRSALEPVLIEPRTAIAGVPIAVIAGVGQRAGAILSGPELPERVEMELTASGRTYRLVDDGTNGDRVAGDGRFTGMVTFDDVGPAVISLHVKSPLLDRTIRETIQISGQFHYRGGPISLDLGAFKAGGEACRDFSLVADHQGRIPFEVHLLQPLPIGQKLEVRSARGSTSEGAKPLAIGPGDPLRICLSAVRRAPASKASGEPRMELAVVGQSSPDARVRFDLRWEVVPLSFWELWGWLILGILAILLILVWLYGYIKPRRFQRNLALVFVQDKDDLDDQSPQPLAQWKGVGIRWYTDARAYLHPNFRVSGNARGAISSLHAIAGGTQVRPGAAGNLSRETIDGEWETVPPSGRRGSSGEVFRVGDSGPYFKIMVRRG